MKNFKERISQVPFNVPIEDPWLLDVFQCIPHFRNQIVTYYKVPSSKSYVVHAEMNGTRFLFSTILALKLFWGYRVENVPLQEVKPTIDETETEFRRRIKLIPYDSQINDPWILDILSHHERFLSCHTYWKKSVYNGFSIQAKDEHGIDLELMSYHSAIRAKLGRKTSKSRHYHFSRACRTAVKYQILQFKYPHTTGEVDHCEKDFCEIVNGWLQENGFNESSVGIRFGINGLTELVQPYKKSFQDYHQRHAKLELISTEEHRRRTSARRALLSPSTPNTGSR